MDEKINTNDIVHHNNTPTVGDEVGEAAGGISGVVAGAAIGSAGGPVGTIIGGLAGAIGGWWAGRAVSETIKGFTHADDTYYRSAYEGSPNRLGDRSYDAVRPAYQLGHIAGQNPEYRGRTFNEVEGDLRQGWEQTASTTHGGWDRVKDYTRDAYRRSADAVEHGVDKIDGREDGRVDVERDNDLDQSRSQPGMRAGDTFDRVDTAKPPRSDEGTTGERY